MNSDLSIFDESKTIIVFNGFLCLRQWCKVSSRRSILGYVLCSYQIEVLVSSGGGGGCVVIFKCSAVLCREPPPSSHWLAGRATQLCSVLFAYSDSVLASWYPHTTITITPVLYYIIAFPLNREESLIVKILAYLFISINNKRTGSYILFISYYYNYSKIYNYYAPPSPNTIAGLNYYMISILPRKYTDIITQKKTYNVDV